MTFEDILKQELNEGISERMLYHFTSLRSLINILVEGEFKLYNYTGCKENENALCTVRPSAKNQNKLGSLSSNIGEGVKIKINGRILSDKVRGVKFKPVAEFPIEVSDTAEIFIKSAEAAGTLSDKMKEMTKTQQKNYFLKHLLLLIKNIKTPEERANKKLTESELKRLVYKDLSFYKKEEKITKFRNEVFFIKPGKDEAKIISEAFIYKSYLNNKEGEERLVLKNKRRIKLDSSYIKIELPLISKIAIEQKDKEKLLLLLNRNGQYFKRKNLEKFKNKLKLEIEK